MSREWTTFVSYARAGALLGIVLGAGSGIYFFESAEAGVAGASTGLVVGAIIGGGAGMLRINS